MAVTIKEIAKKIGISHATVSDVLNDKWQEKRISLDTTERIRQVAEQLNYRRNMVASSLVRQPTREIGKQAVRILLEEIKSRTTDIDVNVNLNVKRVALKPKLVIRESCGASLVDTLTGKSGAVRK